VNVTTLATNAREAVPAAEANRRFSKLLRGVREGRSYVITSHGRPIATIAPAGAEDGGLPAARRALFDRLASQSISKAGRWTRDGLYRR
jgi:prevent-host-death family protein